MVCVGLKQLAEVGHALFPAYRRAGAVLYSAARVHASPGASTNLIKIHLLEETKWVMNIIASLYINGFSRTNKSFSTEFEMRRRSPEPAERKTAAPAAHTGRTREGLSAERKLAALEARESVCVR